MKFTNNDPPRKMMIPQYLQTLVGIHNTHNQIKGTGLSWPFVDYITLLKVKSSVFEIYQPSQIFNLKYIVFVINK